jgi:enolase-phosphatase E1
MRAILLDIEGTVCPIHFVASQLFPYIRANVDGWLRAHWHDAELQQIVEQFRAMEPFLDQSVEALADHVRVLMNADRKVTPLKELQGLMWHDAFSRGELKSPVYPDVRPAFERWSAAGILIAIYSSGSTLAQCDFFLHTDDGDLTGFIMSYFDTRSGSKRESSSYGHIAQRLGLEPRDLLFVSDVRAELDAACAAGMRVVLAVRPGNPFQDARNLERIETFDQIPTGA